MVGDPPGAESQAGDIPLPAVRLRQAGRMPLLDEWRKDTAARLSLLRRAFRRS